MSVGGKALDGLRGVKLTEPNQTLNADVFRRAVGQWEMTFIVKRETTRTHGSVENDVCVLRQPGGWLRSSHPLKSA